MYVCLATRRGINDVQQDAEIQHNVRGVEETSVLKILNFMSNF
jgi:hypothetical protein